VTPNLYVSLVQTRLFWEDPQANLEWLAEKLAQLHGNSDIIILPEMFNTGFSMNTSKADTKDGKSLQWMADMAAKHNAVITGSLMFREGNNCFNRLVWMQPDGFFECYDKRHLFSMAGEHLHYTAGQHRLIVVYKGWKICPLICFDLRFPIWSRNALNNSSCDYDLLIYVANWPEKRSFAWKSLLPARAIENQAYLAAVNRIGMDGNEINYAGDSGIFNFQGEKISLTERFGDKVETIALSAKALKDFREAFPVAASADNFQILL